MNVLITTMGQGHVFQLPVDRFN